MFYQEKKFYYVHKPTNRFVLLEWSNAWEEWQGHFLKEFSPDIIFSAKNVIEETLSYVKRWHHTPHAVSFLTTIEDFELKECFITYSDGLQKESAMEWNSRSPGYF